MKDGVFPIYERFSEARIVIDRLIADDPDFLSLCEDHRVCVNALRHWLRSAAPEAEMRRGEYRQLVQELEKEIGDSLSADEFVHRG